LARVTREYNYYKMIRIVTYIFLFIGAIAFIFPIFWSLLSSFKTLGEITRYPPTFFPEDPTMGGYYTAFVKENFSVFITNSLLIGIVKTAIIVYTSALIGYVLGKIRFPGREKVFIFILITIMIPWPVLILPLYNLMKTLGWYNNYLSIIVPFFLNSFGIFLIRQFTLSIPDEVIESAKMDGAGQFTIFHRIIIPQLGPALSALTIFTFLWVWDDFLWPYIMLTKEKLYTIPIGLAQFKGMNYTDIGAYLAATSVTIIPVIIVYLFAQKRFIEGMTFTGIK